MSPVKSQGRTNATKRKAEAAQNGTQEKNDGQNESKKSQARSRVDGKRKGRGNVPASEDRKANEVKPMRRNKADKSIKTETDQKVTQKRAGRASGNRAPKNGTPSQYEDDSKGTRGKLKPETIACRTTQRKNNNKQRVRPENKRSDKVTESEEEEEESESDAGSSAEVTEDDTSNNEKEDERGSHKETQKSEESSEEEAEASDTQRDTEQTTNKVSEEEVSGDAASKKGSEEESGSSEEEEDKSSDKKTEESEAVSSDGSEDEAITKVVTSRRPNARRTSRPVKQITGPSKLVQEPKHKMTKKTKEEKEAEKAEKQAEKAEKQRAKAEKQRLQKEAKEKAKEEKRNKKKQQKAGKTSTATEEVQSHSAEDESQSANAPVEADPEKEEEEAQPTLSHALKGQNRIMLLKNKGKDLKAFLEPDEQQSPVAAPKGRPQTSLLGKVKITSLKQKANKLLGEETSEGEVIASESNKLKERLIAQKKGMSTFHKMSGWIHKNMPRGINLRKKFSAWTRAISISRWLSLRGTKQKQGPRKTKGSILKHRMAMRVASKTSLAGRKNRGMDADHAGEREGEAKYAVVLPRMNKPGKTESAEVSQAASAQPPGEAATSEPRPPKPGAKLVLPVKPDLSLLKSIKKPLPGGLTPGRDVAGSSGSRDVLEESSGVTNQQSVLGNQEGVSVLQAARLKLDPSQINLSKISLSGGPMGVGRARGRGPEPEGEATSGVPTSTTQPFANGVASAGVAGPRSLYEEEVDREVAQFMGDGGIYAIPRPEVHWAGNPRMSGDPQVCLST